MSGNLSDTSPAASPAPSSPDWAVPSRFRRPLPPWARRHAGYSAVFLMLLGGLVLLGWLFGWNLVTDLGPVGRRMAPLTALATLLSGISLAVALRSLAVLPSAPRRAECWIVRAVSGGILAFSLIRLLSWYLGWNSVVESAFQLLLPVAQAQATMAPPTAIGFSTLNLALLLSVCRRSSHLVQFVAFAGGLVAWLGIAAVMFGGAPLVPYSPMAPHTCMVLLVLSSGILALHPDRGLVRLFGSGGAAGTIARRLVPAATVVPLGLGWFVVAGQRYGWYGPEAGVSLFALGNLLVFGGLIWTTARLLERSEFERHEVTARAAASQSLLEAIAESSITLISVKDLEGRFLFANNRFAEVVGRPREEIVGRLDTELFNGLVAERARELDRHVQRLGHAVEAEQTSELGVTFLTIKHPLRHADGSMYAICGIYTDITERKRAELRVRDSQERTQAIIDCSLDGIISMDAEGHITEFNPAAERIFGLTRSHVLGRPLAEMIIPPRLRGDHQAGLSRYLTSGRSEILGRRIEVTALRSDGTEFPLELSVVRMPGGDAPQFTGFLRDITERRRAEAALRASEERFHRMADSAPDFILVSGSDRRLSWVNRRWLEFVGGTLEEELSGDFLAHIHPEDRAPYDRLFAEAFAARRVISLEFRVRRLDGVWRDLLITSTPFYDGDGEFSGYIASALDITARKESARELLESENRYRMLAESMPQLVWTCLPDGRCDYLSSQWADYTGRPAAEQLGYIWAEAIHPDDRARTTEKWVECVRQGRQLDVEYRLRRADSVYRWFKTRAVPVRNASGEIVKWFGSSTDFDDLKRAEIRLHRQLEFLNLLDQITRAIGERLDLPSVFQVVVRTLEEDLPAGYCAICLYDAAASELTVTSLGLHSHELAPHLGLAIDTRIAIDENGLSRCVRGQLVYEPDIADVPYAFPRRLAAAGFRAVVMAPLQSESRVFGILIAARREADSFDSGECEFLRQLSEHVALAAHQAQIHTALQQAYDDLRQSQQTVLQQERLRALGQMASGIAHDINNAISPVSLYVESLLEREPNLSARARDYLETTQRAIEDVAHTVSRMREFYRSREPQLELNAIQLPQIVKQVIDLTRARWSDIPEKSGIVIEVRTDFAPGVPDIQGIESEIREALINLVFNAVDAMPEGGRLSIAVRSAPANPDEALGDRVIVEVADSGTGMSEETRRRCLEPFYTTKGERGTGLGLAMVYGVAQRHNAEIEVESGPQRGTAVRLVFPAYVPVPLGADPAALPLPVLRLRVLIVDDDPLLLKSLRDALEGDGHSVVAAPGGQAGIEAFRESRLTGRHFSLVITDLGMPHVDGRRVAAAIRGIDPQIPIILLTGWGQRLVAEGDVPPHVDMVLNKPPKLRELRSAFVRLLDPAGRPGQETRSET